MKSRALKALLLTHRWMGVAGGWLILLWFLSGLVMMYARMPALDPGERLRRLQPLDLSSAKIQPSAAAEEAGFAPDRLRIGMLGERPVYRFARGQEWRAVFADSGQPFWGFGPEEATRAAVRFMPECEPTAVHNDYLRRPDQWTLQSRSLFPLHRVACGDARGTDLYLSDRTGEVVLVTSRSGRRWGWLGSVVHWLYFTPFRRHGGLWLQTVIWLSIAGCLIALSGLAFGLWRYFSAERAERGALFTRSPYRGMLRWHHYSGLVFGFVSFTWLLSGCLSLDPWDWHSGTSPTKAQSEAVAGGALKLASLRLESMQNAPTTSKELELIQFQGESRFLAYRTPSGQTTRGGWNSPSTFLSVILPMEYSVISAASNEIVSEIAETELLEAARQAMPQFDILSAERLDDYDAYYYGRAGSRSLPVLRVKYNDPPATWLYLDPYRGVILHREERSSRVHRWLYRGLHRLDFPGLYDRRPLWDLVVIGLSLGGIALAGTTIAPAFGRLGKHARRLWRRVH